MAKPALGKGLGELLNGDGATGPRSATETHTAAVPRLSAGMSALVAQPREPLASTGHTSSLAVLRASLLAADLAMTGGAAILSQHQSPLGWTTTAIALLAVLLGAWLGWLGLTWGREWRGSPVSGVSGNPRPGSPAVPLQSGHQRRG